MAPPFRIESPEERYRRMQQEREELEWRDNDRKRQETFRKNRNKRRRKKRHNKKR